jgi:glycosyltransferase involved in cell wall biosynthesis
VSPPPAAQLLTAAGRPARIALVHDWFDRFYGSERVVAEILRCFPAAELFALVDLMPTAERDFLQGKPVATSFIQRLPFARRHFRQYLPLFPLAIEQFDLGAYDLVLSSSHAFAKGVLTGPAQLHIAYVHAPMRYAWEYQHDYLRQSGLARGLKGALARYLLHRLRLWDQRTANLVDRFIANSAYIARRIRKIYRREAAVIHPPVAIERFALSERRQDYYVAVSRFVPYKHTETIVEAFRALPGRRLLVIGDGPGLERTRKRLPANVTLLGHQPFPVLHQHLQAARALVFAADEDFGITPVEAQACGTPVIAYGAGGVLETVRGLDAAEPTGLFFDAQTPDAIAAAIERFEQVAERIAPAACQANAERFAAARFRAAYAGAVAEAWQAAGGQLATAARVA